MPSSIRVVAAAVFFAGGALSPRAQAQASPYLPLDDPRLPLIEHLITRGDIADPSPQVRPFRRSDALAALAAADSGAAPADSASSSLRLIRALRSSLEELPGKQSWRVGVRGGVQAYSHSRREVLHPLGPDGPWPYGELTGEAVIGPFALVTRPTAEPRIVRDPEWLGRKDLDLAWRMTEAYISAQFKYGRVFYGQMDRNWGPVGLPGIGLSDYAYNRVEAGFLVGTRTLELESIARQLNDTTDAASARVHRYFFAHRLGLRLSERFRLGIWETTVLSGADREFDSRYRNPVSVLLLANQYGLGADGNDLFGTDFRWRVSRKVTVEAQLALDDIQYQSDTAGRYPNRWALTFAGFGPLGRSLSWRALYTQASSLAFRTLNPFENFTDGGVGLGRNYDDQDQLTLLVTAPWRSRWLLTPEITLLRQGEGEINDPFPTSAGAADSIPQIFIGVVERTWRAAIDISGRHGPLDVHLNAGVHHVVNAGHEEGHTVNRFEGRLQATLGLGTRGVLQ